MAACPKCAREHLVQVGHTAVIGLGPPPLQCPRCHGMWLRSAMVDRLKTTGVLEEVDSNDTSRRAHDRKTGICPEAHGIMTRAKVTWEDPYYLERCSRCGGIWFDAGEWNRLASDNLVDHLDDLWSPGWRRRLLESQSQAQLRTDLSATFGAELLADLDALGDELAGRDDATMALAYLRERVRAAQRKESE